MPADAAPLPDPGQRRLAPRIRARLHELYFGKSNRSVRFRLTVIAIDFVMIAFFIAAPLLRETPVFLFVDYAIAFVLATDLTARALARGDDESAALAVGRRVAPEGVALVVRREGDRVVVRASGRMAGPGGLFSVIPGARLDAEAVALAEDEVPPS